MNTPFNTTQVMMELTMPQGKLDQEPVINLLLVSNLVQATLNLMCTTDAMHYLWSHQMMV